MSLPRGNLEGFYHRERTPVKIIGKFTVDAAPAATCEDIHGRGFTCAVTAAGRYTVTFDDQYQSMINARCDAQTVGAAVDLFGQVGAFTAGAAPTLVLRAMTGAVETDILVGDYLHFECTLYAEALDA